MTLLTVSSRLMLAFDPCINCKSQGWDGKGKAMETSSCIYLSAHPLHSSPSPHLHRTFFWALCLHGGPIPISLRSRRAGLSPFPRKELPKQIWQEEIETLLPSQTSPISSLSLYLRVFVRVRVRERVHVCLCAYVHVCACPKLSHKAYRQEWDGLRYKGRYLLSCLSVFHAYDYCHVNHQFWWCLCYWLKAKMFLHRV